MIEDIADKPREWPVMWCSNPSEDDEDGPQHPDLTFKVIFPAYSVDQDQLILPVLVTEKDGDTVEPTRARLKQYGGETILREIAFSDQPFVAGSKWNLTAGEFGRDITALGIDDSFRQSLGLEPFDDD